MRLLILFLYVAVFQLLNFCVAIVDDYSNTTMLTENMKETVYVTPNITSALHAFIPEGYELVEGDILVEARPRRRRRDVDSDKDNIKLWPVCSDAEGGEYYRVPFDSAFPDDYSMDLLNDLRWAMEYIQKGSNIRFVERTTEEQYLRFITGGLCYSFIGLKDKPGGQPVSLGPFCQWKGGVVHELLHALGFKHELTRPDRDNYVDVYPENSFHSFPIDTRNRLGGSIPYDFFSIMHYPVFAHSKSGSPTWLPKDRRFATALFGHRTLLSGCDWYRLNSVYHVGTKLHNSPVCVPNCISFEISPKGTCDLFDTPDACAFKCIFYNSGLLESNACEFSGGGEFPLFVPEMCTVVNPERLSTINTARNPADKPTITITPLPPFQSSSKVIALRCARFDSSLKVKSLNQKTCYDVCFQCPNLYPEWSIARCMQQEYPECLTLEEKKVSKSYVSTLGNNYHFLLGVTVLLIIQLGIV